MKKLKIKQKSNRSGFTLVELVIVIAIVIILSVISVPIYRGYVDKAKISEAYALFGAILSSEKAYYSEYGNFYIRDLGYLSKDTVLGIDVTGNKYFTAFVLGSNNTNRWFYSQMRLPEDLYDYFEGKKFLRSLYSVVNGQFQINDLALVKDI